MPIRSITIDVIPPEGLRAPILASIARYRAACRQLYATLLLAQQAGATIEEREGAVRVTPGSDRAKLALAAAMGTARIERGERIRGEGQGYQVRIGSSFGYEMRELFLQELYPAAKSFVWDSARRDISTAWTAKDPEFPQASRGWLSLQGKRGPAQFTRRAIGIPVNTGRPKLSERTLSLKWDSEIGQVEFSVCFKQNRKPGQRNKSNPLGYWVWKNLRDKTEGSKLGTVFLTEREGRLFVLLSYECPEEENTAKGTGTCHVRWGDGEEFLKIIGPDDLETVSSAHAVAMFARNAAQKAAIEARKDACGSPSRPWGDRQGWKWNQERLSANTRQRAEQQKHLFHRWSARIVDRAVAWRCGTIQVEPRPETIGGHTWDRTLFANCLRYKAQAKQLELILETPTE
jgi:hypothetical protein